ncbi:MAG TPA: hypothetical protein DHM37_07285 [Candidatus Cloacimonas sp.]|nr:hypothetical protein [Candidatus Cloacimonas sp.]
MLAFVGFEDTRVSYWEAVKWVTKLREHNTAKKQYLAINRYDCWTHGRFCSLRLFRRINP